MLRVILIDDEPLALQGLRQLLSAHPGIEIAGEADRAGTAMKLIEQARPDALFLDIRLHRSTGFELLGKLSKKPKVVFFTAHAEHAVRAFEVDAVDYLLKPVSPARLALAVGRLVAACSAIEEEHAYQRDDRICLRTPERTLVATLGSVAALEAEGDFTRVFVAGEPPLLICRKLGGYERALPSPPFVRLDRSLIVNTDLVAAAEHRSRDDAKLRLRGVAHEFSLGRAAQSRLKEHL